jgi:hypothetical protein
MVFLIGGKMKEIKEFENYFVDAEGNVYHKTKGKLKRIKGTITNQGYRRVTLFKQSKPYAKMVHGLVLQAYVGDCPKGMEVCHYDSDRLNNNLSNLRWDTRQENARDKMRHSREIFEREIDLRYGQ